MILCSAPSSTPSRLPPAVLLLRLPSTALSRLSSSPGSLSRLSMRPLRPTHYYHTWNFFFFEKCLAHLFEGFNVLCSYYSLPRDYMTAALFSQMLRPTAPGVGSRESKVFNSSQSAPNV